MQEEAEEVAAQEEAGHRETEEVEESGNQETEEAV